MTSRQTPTQESPMSSISSGRTPYWRLAYENKARRRAPSLKTKSSSSKSAASEQRLRYSSSVPSTASTSRTSRRGLRPESSLRKRQFAASARPISTSLVSGCNNEEHSKPGSLNLPTEDEDSTNEIIMAIDIRGRRNIGCCYYSCLEQKLYLLNDVEAGGLEVIEILKTTLEPTVILLPARADEDVDEVLNSVRVTSTTDIGSKEASLVGILGSRSMHYEETTLPYAVEVLSNKDFDCEKGKRNMATLDFLSADDSGLALKVPGDDDLQKRGDASLDIGFTTLRGRLTRLAALIDLESRLSIGCAGAVLSYIRHHQAQGVLSSSTRSELTFHIQSIGMFSLDKTMHVCSDTLASLQIVESESHPHMQNQGPNTYGSKESLSVYGLFHHLASSPQGKQKLRQIFLRPSLDVRLITERQNSVSAFICSANQQSRESIIKSMKSIKNLRPVLLHLRKGITGNSKGSKRLSSGTWMTIRSFTFHTLEILTAVRQLDHNGQLDIRSIILETFDPRRIALIGQSITTVVDFRTSAEEGRPIVNVGVDEDLDALKRTYAGIDDFLNQLSRAIVNELPLQHVEIIIEVITYPQIGFLIGVRKDPQTGLSPDVPDSRDNIWERIFSTEGMTYYKDNRMKSLDAKYGDIAGNIYDREIEITFDLARRVLEHEDFLCRLSDVCGHLDTLLALAQGAILYDLSRPILTARNMIDIKGGRHILQERVTDNFIPNDIALEGGDEGSETASTSTSENRRLPNMLLLTGPNFSGKSVYLKQVALIVYLAHIGSFVPAEAATIGITDKIIARVATRETVSTQHSAFTIDLQQIANALHSATERSLVLIDEFGKGTNTDDGAGLSYAILNYFSSSESVQPKVIAATHFHELFENGLLVENSNLYFAHMAVIVNNTRQLDEQVTYLYELKPGRNIASYGTVCALLNGIPSAIIDRATEILQLRARGILSAQSDQLTNEEKENLAHIEDIARQFLRQDFASAEDGREWLLSNTSNLLRCSAEASTTSR